MYNIKHQVQIDRSGPITINLLETMDIWVPIPLNAKIKLISPTPKIITNDTDINCNLCFLDNVSVNSKINLEYSVNGIPRVPTVNPISIITNHNILNKYDNVNSLIKDLNIDQNKSKKEIVETVINYLIDNLTYSFPPETRDPNTVLTKMCSDCGGYHNVFVEILVRLGIPAIIDFGYVLDKFNVHAWAWWFDTDNKTWVFEDLRDRQKGNKYTDYQNVRPRMSMTLGFMQELTPPYPRPVLFLQECLGWDKNYDLRKLKGGKLIINSKIELDQ